MNTFLEAMRLDTVLRLIAKAEEQRQMLGKVAASLNPEGVTSIRYTGLPVL